MTNLIKDFKLRQNRPTASGRAMQSPLSDRFKTMLQNAEGLLAEEFKGITSKGNIIPDLYPIGRTGVSNDGMKKAADAYLESLDPQQRNASIFDIDSEMWHRWSNIHPYLMRHGSVLDEKSTDQRDLALALLRESLSDSGFEMARNIMKLNDSMWEITGSYEEYGEWLYWISIMGTPSADEPWGWQIDGHHLIINAFVLGDQLVTTPMFMGSEPVAVDDGKHAGTRVFQVEEQAGLALGQSLTASQRSKAVIGNELPGDVFTSAFRDNFELRYEGIGYDELAGDQQDLLLGLVGTYLNRMRPGHAQAKMDEVKQHLQDTHLAWIGGMDDDSVFYYRIHSPVILIEFDHQRGIALDNDEPTRQHIHTIVRTPNGNDYGKDLLRQHREQVVHADD